MDDAGSIEHEGGFAMQISLARVGASVAMLGWCAASSAALTCDDITHFLSDKAVGVVCFKTDDLRPSNPLAMPVTPANSPAAGAVTYPDGSAVPLGALQASTDPTVISIGPTPTPSKVPGIQVMGWYAEEPRQARFLLRFPENWNGKLVVAGAGGDRRRVNRRGAWGNDVF